MPQQGMRIVYMFSYGNRKSLSKMLPEWVSDIFFERIRQVFVSSPNSDIETSNVS